MSIQVKVAELLKHGKIAEMLRAAQSSKSFTAGKTEVKSALQSLGEFFQRNKHPESVATMLALLLGGADDAIARMRRDGLLRASRYAYRSGAVSKTIEAALGLAPQLNLRPDRLAYLRSVSALLKAAPEARSLRNSLIVRLKARRDVAQKTLLYLVNEAFSKDLQGDRTADSNLLQHWSSEDLSQAVSYIIALMRKEFGTDPKLWQHVDEQLPGRFENIYEGLLLDAARLNELADVETLIDGMPYEVMEDGHRLKVFSSDEALEKSIRLGYIQSATQAEIRTHAVIQQYTNHGQELPTIALFVKEAFEAGMDRLFELRTQPFERLVFGVIQDDSFFAPIRTDSYFADEVANLYGIGVENFLLTSAPDLRVSEKLTAIDIMKIQRFFNFLHAAYEEMLKGIDGESRRRVLSMRSVLPILSADDLRRQLEFILPKEKVADAIELLTLAEDQKYIDLQYKPLISVGSKFIIAPALFFRSNLVRNIVTANNLRGELLITPDPMQEKVVKALKDQQFLVRENFEFNMDGKRETDIICWRDGHLFVFECKNSFHPCSAHEIRTSYEHLRKAKKQLDIRLPWLQVKENQERLLKWLGWNVPVTTNIHTGIITANRVFNGFTIGSHPVRQAHEVSNVISTGEAHFSDGQTVRFWQYPQLHAQDLVDYLQGGTVIQQQFALLQPFERRIQIGKIDLALQTYYMDGLTAGKVRIWSLRNGS